jgi:hypothetical protein
MLTRPAELWPLMGAFAPLLSKPVWEHAKVLLVGAILGPRSRGRPLGLHKTPEKSANQRRYRLK